MWPHLVSIPHLSGIDFSGISTFLAYSLKMGVKSYCVSSLISSIIQCAKQGQSKPLCSGQFQNQMDQMPDWQFFMCDLLFNCNLRLHVVEYVTMKCHVYIICHCNKTCEDGLDWSMQFGLVHLSVMIFGHLSAKHKYFSSNLSGQNVTVFNWDAGNFKS